MATNLLKAIVNLTSQRNNNIMQIYKSHTRINSAGDALEYYIKDLFCGTLNSSMADKEVAYTSNFSYLGNQNNPPDFIIKNGDAVEVKKIEGKAGSIALNSSYPKSKLLKTDRYINDHCRSCEQWNTKDYIYIVGTVAKERLNLLWMVYGDCYAADKAIYERVFTAIKQGVKSIKGVQFSETAELGKVKKVDPLGITLLRVRGMWHIEHPVKVFDYIAKHENNGSFEMFCLMRTDKYDSFPKSDREKLEQLVGQNLSVVDVEIKNPNNPAQRITAKLLKLTF